MVRFAFSTLIALSAVFNLSATPACISGNSLASYEALGAGGCIDNGLQVYSFSFSSGGFAPVSDTNIAVTTTATFDSVGLIFSSAGFNVPAGQSTNYTIGYTWDPTGDIRGLGDVLDPGPVDIVTDGCVGFSFTPTCAGTTVSVHVFQPSQLTDSVYFTPTAVLGIVNNINLNGGLTGASFNSIENDVYLPEPGTVLLSGCALLAVCSMKKKLCPNILP